VKTNWKRTRVALAVAAVGVVGLAAPAGAYDAAECQECHGDLAIVEGGKGYLYIDPAQYGRTAHAQEGCPACHVSVTDAHPGDGVRPSRASCGDCHEDVATEYAASVHGANAGCTDCHNPHEAKGVAAVSGAEMNRACNGCHESADVIRSHGTWLLQAELHVSALPCITCHTGSEQYVITFYIERVEERTGRVPRVAPATVEDLQRWLGPRPIDRAVDADGDGTVSVRELQVFNRAARDEGFRLWGMMTPERASHAFTTLDNRWDCTFCHASGPGTLQTSFVAVPDGEGVYRRVPVERGAILEALYGTPDFYMVGAGRNRTLTVVGLAIAAAGLLMPLGHGTLRLLTMRNRREG
jgi:predicted CXXCH cytochrome family protein